MKKSWVNIVIGSIILSTFVFADVKIGYIDSNEIMTKFEEVRQVQVSLEKGKVLIAYAMNKKVDLDEIKNIFLSNGQTATGIIIRKV